MKLEDIKAYCLNKHKAQETYPFGDIPICYKLNNKIFAQIYPKESDYKIWRMIRCFIVLVRQFKSRYWKKENNVI